MSDPFLAEIRIFPFSFPPSGWAFCNGQLLPISQNPALYSLIGTIYGGNGTTNFALPNLQGRSAMYWGQSPGGSEHVIGETGGEQQVTLNDSQMPAHAHGLQASARTADLSSPGPSNALARSTPQYIYKQPAGATPAQLAPGTVVTSGGSLPHNNMQPYLTLNFCIALQGIGTRLLTVLLAEAAAAGKPVRMHVERFNPARRLYDRLGFREIADKGVYLLLECQPGSVNGSPNTTS